VASGQAIGFTAFQAPSSTIGDDAMNANSPAGVTKTRHLHIKGTHFNTVIGDTPTTKEVIIHRAAAAGTIRNVRALLEDSGTSTSIAFDLKKYQAGTGATVLSSVITVVHGTGDCTAVAGSIATAPYIAGDVFAISMTVTSSTGALGPWAEAEFDELAA